MDMQIQIKYEVHNDPDHVQIHFLNAGGEKIFTGTIMNYNEEEVSNGILYEVLTIRVPGLAKVIPYE